ncbi:mandelate racemase muconate lactonizing enzyme family protein [Grosmannia clavigera kw1407]|uniref:Mandelate racemase muconate lactonizing enzyme family protein n=1 Tax=Grosmannia clavigera (strain kw1407 / UAMH 11150) TaxID=655863 RepID=F0XT56_GROCL|nr:mandelate racemase muconate lactonizing enzyme family protein [Grosmannia clavigera kw1407]EFW99389.1 mandelate racemase muconate lactonizing enzyme family protein [Grosmannia clavigera kw1407]
MGKIATMEWFRVPPRWLFVKITDEAGNVGWGEASLEGHSQAVEGCLDAWFARYKGMEADDIEHIWQLSWRTSFYRGGPVFMSALSGIDIALWDLKARKLGVPIYQLLGGKLRTKLRVYAWIGGDRPGDVVNQAPRMARREQGFRAVKMNGTEDLGWLDRPAALDDCVERVKAVRALGIDVGVDFHGRVHKPMAKQLARALEPHRPLFIEEPLLSEHGAGIEQLAGLTTLPIALGERLHSRWDVRALLPHIDVLQPDVAHVGGISELRRIAAMAETYDVALAPHCPLGPIALAACVQVDAASPNFAIQEMSLGIHYNSQLGHQDLTSYTTNPEVWTVHDGYIHLLEGPGLGINIDEDQVRRLAKDTEPWVSPGFLGPGGEVREW